MEVELDIYQEIEELLERIAIIASDKDIKLAYYAKASGLWSGKSEAMGLQWSRNMGRG